MLCLFSITVVDWISETITCHAVTGIAKKSTDVIRFNSGTPWLMIQITDIYWAASLYHYQGPWSPLGPHEGNRICSEGLQCSCLFGTKHKLTENIKVDGNWRTLSISKHTWPQRGVMGGIWSFKKLYCVTNSTTLKKNVRIWNLKKALKYWKKEILTLFLINYNLKYAHDFAKMFKNAFHNQTFTARNIKC